jgi:hypothetical protein
MFRSVLMTVLIILIAFASESEAFAPIAHTFSTASHVAAAKPARAAAFVLRMAEEEKKTGVSADGTFYDDEVSHKIREASYSIYTLESS